MKMKIIYGRTTGIFGLKLMVSMLLTIFLSINMANCQSITTSSPLDDVQKWVEQHFAKGKVPPFSFEYGGKSSNNFIQKWKYSSEKMKSTDPNVDESVYSYTDKQSGLVVKCFVTCFN